MAEAKTIFARASQLPQLHLGELPSETRLALQELERETSGLDRESEIIGNLVNTADEQLRKIAPKIPIWLEDEIDPTKPFVGRYSYHQVGWARVSDTEWGLACRVIEVIPAAKGKDADKRIVAWRNISDVESSPSPTAPLRIALNQAPIVVRIAALGKLPKLIQTLTKLARRRREALEACRRALEQNQ